MNMNQTRIQAERSPPPHSRVRCSVGGVCRGTRPWWRIVALLAQRCGLLLGGDISHHHRHCHSLPLRLSFHEDQAAQSTASHFRKKGTNFGLRECGFYQKLALRLPIPLPLKKMHENFITCYKKLDLLLLLFVLSKYQMHMWLISSSSGTYKSITSFSHFAHICVVYISLSAPGLLSSKRKVCLLPLCTPSV